MISLGIAHQMKDFLITDIYFWNFFMYITFALFAAFFAAIIKKFIWRQKYNSSLPGKKVRFFSLLGNLSEFPLKESSRNGYSVTTFLLQMLDGYAKLFPKESLFAFWLAYEPFIVLKKADAVEAVLKGTSLLDKSWIYEWFQSALGTGLVTISSAKWKPRRKWLNSSFRHDKLMDVIPEMNKYSRVLVGNLQKETDKEFTDITLAVALCIFDIMCKTLLDVHVGAQDTQIETFSKFNHAMHRGGTQVIERIANIFLWLDCIYHLTEDGKEFMNHLKTSEEFSKLIIKANKYKYFNSELKSKVSKKVPLIDILLEHHLKLKDLTEEDVKDEITTFAAAGVDTLTISICLTLYLIGLYPHVQRKIHQELSWVFSKDADRDVTEKDLKDMKYLECVIKESHRLYPPVPIFGRHAVEDIDICGHRVPKGSTLLIMPYLLHKDEEVFPDPEKFDPDRFLPENSANRHPFAYIPFAAGPRNCIGQRYAMIEEKIILSTILRHYTVESLDERDRIVPACSVVLTISDPIRIRFRSINCNLD